MNDMHSKAGPFRTGGIASAEEGCVLLDGPDGIAIALTPDAAEETGNNLIAAARAARAQSELPSS
jgi:hypothetical protein